MADVLQRKLKPGKVLRVDKITWDFIQEKRRRGETTSALMRRLIGLPSRKGIIEAKTKFALPSDLYETIDVALGAAVQKKVREKRKSVEEPLPVRILT